MTQVRCPEKLDHLKEPNVNVEVKLIRFINRKPDTTHISSKAVHGVTEFKEGERFVLWVKNPGTEVVYFNILDMQPDGIINPVLPNRIQSLYARDLRIEPGVAHLFNRYLMTVTPPYGEEIYKVFAATDAQNLNWQSCILLIKRE